MGWAVGGVQIQIHTRTSSHRTRRKTRTPPVARGMWISTNPRHVNLDQLTQLYKQCNHSCYRFPSLDDNLDLLKLRVALTHSFLVVSVFCTNPPTPPPPPPPPPYPYPRPGDLLQNLSMSLRLTPSHDSLLIGFGRVISDYALTASIHDVMVLPKFRAIGVGRMIVKRIIRDLTSKDIYDISALCSENERLFFKACGFGDDILGSTTMMYTRSASSDSKDIHIVKRAGRKMLLVPSLREPFE